MNMIIRKKLLGFIILAEVSLLSLTGCLDEYRETVELINTEENEDFPYFATIEMNDEDPFMILSFYDDTTSYKPVMIPVLKDERTYRFGFNYDLKKVYAYIDEHSPVERGLRSINTVFLEKDQIGPDSINAAGKRVEVYVCYITESLSQDVIFSVQPEGGLVKVFRATTIIN